MVNPVIHPKGKSYERSAILDWVEEQISPATASTLAAEDLYHNTTLLEAMQQYAAAMDDEDLSLSVRRWRRRMLSDLRV